MELRLSRKHTKKCTPSSLNWRATTVPIYGRRMCEFMAAWQALPTRNPPSFMADFANMWRAAERVRCNPFQVGCEPNPWGEQTRNE